MAETDPDTESSSHVVIDVEAVAAEVAADDEAAAAAATSSSSCLVCTEPMEWVAVPPCGHGVVCARCAAHIRFFHNDLRCCICRSHCATVFVTRAAGRRATTTHEGFPLLMLPAPAPLGGQGLGVNYWYHRGMGAYFDDVSQYQEMNKLCTAAASSSSLPSSRSAGVNNVVVDANVVSAGTARQADDDADAESLERPLSRQDRAVLVLLGLVGAFWLASPFLYLIPT